MSGLIWSGIGQGIANAGQAVGGMMMKDIEYQRQLQAEDRKEANYLKRLEEAQRIKDEAAEAKAEALQQRVIQETTAAQAAGAEAPGARMAGQLKTLQGQIAGESPAMSEAEIQQLIKENPQYKKVYEEAGYVTKRDERRERAEGAILSAMAAGAHSTTKKDLQALRDAVIKEIGDEFKEDKETAYRAQQAAQNEATNKRLELLAQDVKTRERNADTYASRPTGGGGKGDGGSKAPKTETTADLDRIVKRSEADAARAMGVDRKDFNTAYARLQKRTDPASVALLEKVQPYVDELNDASSRLKKWKAGAARTEAAPAAATGNRPALSTFGK
jgi:hypothetical protein